MHYVQRRRRVPQRTLSPLVETATLLTTSIVTNLLAVGLFAVVRLLLRRHTPDVTQLLAKGSAYAIPRSGYLLVWAVLLLAVSCVFALTWAAISGGLGSPIADRLAWLPGFLTPVIVDVSAWYHVFEEGPSDCDVYVGCDLRDGTYIAGTLDWYSTEVDETADRDFVLAPPLLAKAGNAEDPVEGFQRIVVSARDVVRLYVTFLRKERETVLAGEADE
jgi:hypothetical protein